MLTTARAMVEQEVGDMLQDMRGAYDKLLRFSGDELWRDAERSEVWLPQTRQYVSGDKVSEKDWVEKHRLDLAKRRERMVEDAARAAKIERKLGVTLGGYQSRSKVLNEKIEAAYKEFEQAKLDTGAFGSLYASEQATIPARIERAEEELRKVEAHESQLQQEYQDLLDRRNQLAA
ncbi:CDC5 cell division cycle 5-like protein [Coemansia sp. RSA 1937]|nr:CDC5 cell division cycle 5-like protein [Coemansia sp. RSA 1937]